MITAILLYSYCIYTVGIIGYLVYNEYNENSLHLISL